MSGDNIGNAPIPQETATADERLKEENRLLDTIPSNWCDPLLTGTDGVVGPPYDCSDIERLLNGIRKRLRVAVAEKQKPLKWWMQKHDELKASRRSHIESQREAEAKLKATQAIVEGMKECQKCEHGVSNFCDPCCYRPDKLETVLTELDKKK